MSLYEVRTLKDARLTLFASLKGQVSFSDFCNPAGTIDFNAYNGFLTNSLKLFSLEYPGYELEAKIERERVFVRRNEYFQHSERFSGKEPCHVAIQWDLNSICCGVMQLSDDKDSMNDHIRCVRTPTTIPPLELVRELRTHNLLENSSYRTVDDLFATVLDCIHLCEFDIRRHGCEKYVWKKVNDSWIPLDEPEISRFVAGYLSSHGASRNFEVVCEPIAGSGKIDFHVVAPIIGASLGKIAIEAKRAESKKLIDGLQTQLPEYMHRMGTNHGIYLVYWMKSKRYPLPADESYSRLEIDKLHPISRTLNMRTVAVDLSYGDTPSKL